MDENITDAQMEVLVERTVAKNMIEKERADKLKRRLLGGGAVVRNLKQTADFSWASLKDFLSPANLSKAAWDWLTTLYNYLISTYK